MSFLRLFRLSANKPIIILFNYLKNIFDSLPESLLSPTIQFTNYPDFHKLCFMSTITKVLEIL